MHDETCYSTDFLKEVIVRLDFSAPEPSIGESIPAKLGNAAVARFPELEPRKKVQSAYEFQAPSGDVVEKDRSEFTEWNYYGTDREKRLAIAPACIFITYSRYPGFETLKVDFLDVLRVLFETYPDIRGSRLGLRYINHIELQTQDPFDWGEYIDEGLLGLLGHFSRDRETVTRLFNIAEFKHDDDVRLKFQFGVPNRDYPAPLRYPLFVLDIDAYIQRILEPEDVSRSIDDAHAHVQKLFEDSITDGLRKRMDAERTD